MSGAAETPGALGDTKMTIADLLTASRISWSSIVALGGDIEAIRVEAVAAGDSVLASRAARALARR